MIPLAQGGGGGGGGGVCVCVGGGGVNWVSQQVCDRLLLSRITSWWSAWSFEDVREVIK